MAYTGKNEVEAQDQAWMVRNGVVPFVERHGDDYVIKAQDIPSVIGTVELWVSHVPTDRDFQRFNQSVYAARLLDATKVLGDSLRKWEETKAA